MSVWKRPQMPKANQVGLILWAAIFIVGAVPLYIWGLALLDTYERQAGAVMMTLAGAGEVLGWLFLLFGLVIREIRQHAFEAALRAGEVKRSPEPTKPQAPEAPKSNVHEAKWAG